MPPGVGYRRMDVEDVDYLDYLAKSPLSNQTLVGQESPVAQGVQVNFNPDGSISRPLAVEEDEVPGGQNVAKAETLARAAQAQPVEQVAERQAAAQEELDRTPPPTMPTSRLGAIAAQGRRQTAGHMSNLEDVQREEVQALNRYNEAAAKRSEIVGRAASAELAVREDYDRQLADKQKEKQRYYNESQAKLQDDLKYSHTSLDRTDFNRLEAIAGDISLPEAQRSAARAKLKQSEEIDPDRVLGGAATRVAAGIFAGLGAMGAGMTGGPNSAMQIIEGAIDRDVAAQRQNFAKKRQAYLDKKQARGEALDFMKTEEQDLVVQKLRKLEAATTKVKVATASSDSEMARQQGAQLTAQIEQRHGEILHNAAMKDVDTRLGAEAQRQQLDIQREGLELRRAQAGAGPQVLPEGVTGRPVSRKALDDSMKMYGSALSSMRTLKDLSAHRKAHGVETLNRKAVAEGKSLASQAHLEFKNLAELGVLAGPDMGILTGLVPEDPGEFGYVEAKLGKAEDYVDRKIKSYLQARGLGVKDRWWTNDGSGGGQAAQDPAFRPVATMGGLASR